jgi:hypothetical protein
MTRFLINKNGVYYLTTGKLLKYDKNEAKDDKQKKGFEETEEMFGQIRDQPHTWYQAVEIKSAKFGPMNTGQSD